MLLLFISISTREQFLKCHFVLIPGFKTCLKSCTFLVIEQSGVISPNLTFPTLPGPNTPFPDNAFIALIMEFTLSQSTFLCRDFSLDTQAPSKHPYLTWLYRSIC